MRGIYKYVDKETGEIIYIGKSKDSITARINAHKTEEKFREYVSRCNIYYVELPNAVEIDLLERALINKYKPILNDTDNLEGFSSLIQVNEPDWKEYGVKPLKQKDNVVAFCARMNKEALDFVRDYAFTNRLTQRQAFEKIVFEFREQHKDCDLLQRKKRQ